jgi:hypothetical protein
MLISVGSCRSGGRWLPDVVRFSKMMSSFGLTNGKAYIRFEVWNLVQIQPTGSEEFVSASDAVSWRDDALLIQVVSGAFCSKPLKQTDVPGGSEIQSHYCTTSIRLLSDISVTVSGKNKLYSHK